MKRFAITPDWLRAETLIERLGSLVGMGVSFLYLRSPALHGSIETLLPEISGAGMLPIVSIGVMQAATGIQAGIHFRSADLDRLSDAVLRSGALTTASSHSMEEAAGLLERGVNYVFVSPVFPPLSKPMEPGGVLFPRAWLRELVGRYGERVVALGGMTRDRIRELRSDLGHDFSVAGITLFFTPRIP